MPDDLQKSFVASIRSPLITDLVADTAEVALDSVIEHEVLQNVPLFATLVKIWRVGVGIRERFFARKIFRFFAELASLTASERERFAEELEGDPERRRKVSELFLIYLDRADEERKAAHLARVLSAHVRGEIDLGQARHFASIIDRAYLPHLSYLAYIYDVQDDYFIRRGEQRTAVTHLMMLGLIDRHDLTWEAVQRKVESRVQASLTGFTEYRQNEDAQEFGRIVLMPDAPPDSRLGMLRGQLKK